MEFLHSDICWDSWSSKCLFKANKTKIINLNVFGSGPSSEFLPFIWWIYYQQKFCARRICLVWFETINLTVSWHDISLTRCHDKHDCHHIWYFMSPVLIVKLENMKTWTLAKSEAAWLWLPPPLVPPQSPLCLKYTRRCNKYFI